MKMLLIALLFATAAHAASPEEAYLAARDKYIAQLKPKEGAEIDDKTTKAERRARADLEKQLRRIIAPPQGLQGKAREGKLNLESLIEGDQGFGQLDALNFTLGGKTRVTVTTRPLLVAWLKAHQTDRIPAEPNAALQSEDFHTQALSSGAAFARFADIPVTAPAGFATAMLGMHRQDIGLFTPQEIVVALISGEKLTVASAPAAAKVTMIPACEAVWKELESKAQALYEKYQASDLKDDKLFDQYTKTEEEGDVALRKCFAERAKDAPFFAALSKQAQGLVDRLK
jgi:hypothetical protein